jgi:hypothetical protein
LVRTGTPPPDELLSVSRACVERRAGRLAKLLMNAAGRIDVAA